jgi:hypothetical protein
MHSGLQQDRTKWPIWVRLALWKITTRRAVTVGWVAIGFLFFVWLLFAAQGVNCWILLYWEGIGDARTAALELGRLFMTVVLAFLSVVWYWAALRWVDRHGQRY